VGTEASLLIPGQLRSRLEMIVESLLSAVESMGRAMMFKPYKTWRATSKCLMSEG
jgi:hypothetical protein